MRKSSIFNNDHRRIMRRRKIVYRTLILFVALAVIFFTYNKSAIPNLKKFAESLKISSKSNVIQVPKDDMEKPEIDKDTDADSTVEKNNQEQVQVTNGEFTFKFPTEESIAIIYEKHGNDIKITGVSPENTGITYDIRDDDKAIVFDNPRDSDIWVFNVDGSSRRLNPDKYVSYGDKKEYPKAEVMKWFENKYIWAERPKFLKDGRIVYQSNLPWFNKQDVYMWVVNSDGTGNKMFLQTNQANPVTYSGYTSDGKLILEYGGSKYTFNTEDRSKQKVD